MKPYFLTQGIILTALALALFLAPEFMITIWPWNVTRMLVQIYSGPFLAFGLSSLMLSRQQTWSQVRIATVGTFVLAIGVMPASILHLSLFTLSNPSTGDDPRDDPTDRRLLHRSVDRNVSSLG